MNENNIDVLLLTEVWLTMEDLDSIVFPGYKPISSYIRQIRIHGGICIYAKTNLDFHNICVKDLCAEIDAEFGLFELKNTKISFCCVYRSPDGDSNIFQNNLDRMISEKISSNNKVLVVGDFNYNFKTNDNKAIECKTIFLSHDRQEKVFVDTRMSNSIGTRVDNLLTNLDNKSFNLKVVEPHLSYHRGILFSIKNVTGKSNNNIIICRPMTKKSI